MRTSGRRAERFPAYLGRRDDGFLQRPLRDWSRSRDGHADLAVLCLQGERRLWSGGSRLSGSRSGCRLTRRRLRRHMRFLVHPSEHCRRTRHGFPRQTGRGALPCPLDGSRHRSIHISPILRTHLVKTPCTTAHAEPPFTRPSLACRSPNVLPATSHSCNGPETSRTSRKNGGGTNAVRKVGGTRSKCLLLLNSNGPPGR